MVEVDFVGALAGPLPVIVISQLLGITAEHWERTSLWSYSLGSFLTGAVAGPDHAARMQQDVLALISFFEHLVDTRRKHPGEDMLSALLAAGDVGERLSTQELIVNLILLFAAGHLTTTHLLSNSLLALSRFPQQWQILIDHPTLVPGAIGELLRFDAPVQAVQRQALEDVEMHGKLIRMGDQVTAFLGSANRDETCYAEPNELDVQRAGTRILSFGHGIHACLGAALARLEAEVVLRKVMERFPGFRVAVPQPARLQNFMVRGVTYLPVVLE